MKKIEITRKEKQESYTVIVDDRDSDLFEKYTYHIQVNLSGHAYVRRWVKPSVGRKSYPHINLQWDVYTRYCGAVPEGKCIDHINGNTLDNRLENLRLATRRQNRINSKGVSDSISQYKGVTRRGDSWGISIHYGDYHITCRTVTEIEAAKLADKIYFGLYGEFARLNFPKQIKKAI